MKIVLLTSLCALLGGAAAGAVAWPGAAVALSSPLFKTIIPPQTKAFSYSTTQYINSLPVSYPVGLHSQFAYQVPQLSGFSPIQQAYYPIAGPSFTPANNLFYPSVAGIAPAVPSAPGSSFAPAAPMQPAEGIQSFPAEQSTGDTDTAVIDSAEFQQQSFLQQQIPSAGVPLQSQSSKPQFPPANTFPNFPPFPQIPQGSWQAPSFPSIPQFPQISVPGFPSLAGNAPAVPSTPTFPNAPAAPAQPSEGSQRFPADQSAGDADTAVIESAEFQQQFVPQQQQQQTPATEAPLQSQSSEPQFPPANTFPNFPSFPQIPQGSGQAPSFPSIPQFPQISVPEFPQFPQLPSGPNAPQAPSLSPPSTFPGDASGNKGLNDEDTISVESA